MKRIINLDGSINKDSEPKVAKNELIKWHESMVALRTLDEKGMKLQRQGRIGFHVPTTGQEAHVGVAAAIEDEDWVFPAYREHGVAIYRGYPLEKIVHHFFANEMDPQKGRRLPGLFGDYNIHFVNPSAPIGTQIIHATGAGYAMKYKNEKRITVVFFGDGATSSNDFHSGLNFAGVFETPTIFYCQNNGWAISVPRHRQTAAQKISDKAIGYGFEGVQIDGNDILAVYSTVLEAAKKARKGKGPTLIEAVTYRLGPHTSSDDPTRYRSEEEVKKWQELDPIKRFEQYLMGKGILSQAEIEQVWQKYDELLKKLITNAAERPRPPIETLFTDVYEELPWHLREQLEEVKSLVGDE